MITFPKHNFAMKMNLAQYAYFWHNFTGFTACHLTAKSANYSSHMTAFQVQSDDDGSLQKTDRQMDAFHGEGILQTKHFTAADIAEEGIDGDGHRILVHCGASTQSPSFVCLLSSCYQLGCTLAAVSAQRPVEHVKNALQNIMTEWTPHSVVRLNGAHFLGGGQTPSKPGNS